MITTKARDYQSVTFDMRRCQGPVHIPGAHLAPTGDHIVTPAELRLTGSGLRRQEIKKSFDTFSPLPVPLLDVGQLPISAVWRKGYGAVFPHIEVRYLRAVIDVYKRQIIPLSNPHTRTTGFQGTRMYIADLRGRRAVYFYKYYTANSQKLFL